MTSATKAEPLVLAELARALVQAQPQRAHALAERALAEARRLRLTEAEVAALHALGFARYVLGDPRALATTRAAVRAGERHGHGRRAAMVRRNLAVYLAYAGRAAEALREIEAARGALTGIERARTAVFRIAVYELAGRPGDALAGSSEALRALRRHGDDLWEARLLYNRANVMVELGDPRRARREIERASDIYARRGLDAAVADARIELARLRLMEGDPLASLAELDAIVPERLAARAASWRHLARAEAYVALRLLPEARADLRRFEEASARAKTVDSTGKARLDAARLSLLIGDSTGAASIGASARRSFAARGQSAFAAAATLVCLESAIHSGAVTPSMIRAGRKAVATLTESNRSLAALRGRLLVAHGLAVSGADVAASKELDAAAALDRRGTVADRIELRHVRGLVRLIEGRGPAAERSLRAGLALLELHRGSLGASELKATSSAVGVELAELGLRTALRSGTTANVLAWAETLRANALRLPPVRPPADPELRACQAELRAVTSRVRRAEENGAPAPGLVARQTALESAIRNRARHVRGKGAAPRETPRATVTAQALGDRVLVEYIELDGILRALTLAAGRLELHELGGDAAQELEWLRFSLGRLARKSITPAQRAASLDSARAAAGALDRLLVEPLRTRLGDAPLVIVPTGKLHALPWGALPSLRGRAVVVSPSLAGWLELARRPRSRRRGVVLLAGPRLRHAAAEVTALAELHPESTVLTGQAATAEGTLAALDGAALGHLACHGRFRADSPLFSALELADGPLTALDLQGLRRAPDVLVLSACDVALSDRHPGDELLGLSAALLGMGTRTIVASVVPVPDAAARRLMLAFHGELSRGAPPAAALARAQAALRGRSAALAGFVCLGSG